MRIVAAIKDREGKAVEIEVVRNWSAWHLDNSISFVSEGRTLVRLFVHQGRFYAELTNPDGTKHND